MYKTLVCFAMVFLFVISLSASISAQECFDGDTRQCGSNVGVCESGERSCQNGEWGDCTGETAPVDEICGNELDDDCDGLVDECVMSLWQILILVGFAFFVIMVLLLLLGF